MNKLKELSVGKQVLFMFGTLCAVLGLLGALLFYSLRSIERSGREQLTYVVDEAQLVATAAQNVGLMQAMIFRQILASTPEEIRLHDQAIHEIDMANAEKIAAYQKFVDTEEEARLYARVLQARTKYLELTERLLVFSRANRDAEAEEFAVSDQLPAYTEYQRASNDMTRYVQNEVRDIGITMDRRVARIRLTGDVFIVIAILIATGMGFAFTGVARRLKDDNGSLQIEITERKAADKSLRDAEEKYRSIYENSNDGIFQNTPDGRFLSANPALARMLGFDSPEELISGRVDIESQGYADPTLRHKFREKLEENGCIAGFEYEVYRKDGAKIWVAESSRAVRDVEGRILYYEGSVQNITERKQAENALGESERRFSDMLGNLELVAVMLDRDSCVTYCNDYLLRVTGWRREEVIGRDWCELFLPGEMLVEMRDVHSALLANQPTASHHENEILTRSGTRRLIAWNNSVLRSASGQIIGTASIGEDITERKWAETARDRLAEELRASKRFAESIAENSTNIIYLFDIETGKNAYTNRDAAEALGYSSAQILEMGGNLLATIVHPEDLARVVQHFAQFADVPDDRTVDIEYRMRHASGDTRWIWSRDTVFNRRPDGATWQIMGTAQDITDRKKTELALWSSEERFRLVARATDDAIWDWNVVANTITFSESLRTLFGYRAGQFESTMDFWIGNIHPDDHDAVMASVHQFFATREESWSGEYRFRCADGSYVFVYDRGHVVRDAEGKPLRMVGSMMNITKQKQAQEDLRIAKEGAESASRTKSEFLANMSHEIRTPMNGIIGMTDLVLETELDREQREYLGMVKSSAHSLLGLINDILDFSKIEAGRLELESIDFSLRDCIGVLLKPLGLRADQKGLELVADISADVPDHVIGDPMRLRQILINLTDNAIKFTERGDVLLRVAVESTTADEQFLRFSVSDTGPGIPREKQALIFDAFSQADGSTTRTHGGTGLGLAIASQLVRQMGGRIWVESTVGEGTTFHFTAHLPVRHTPAPDVRPADARQLNGLRVLVVDDNEVHRRVLREMLANWRMEPSVVASGAAAIVEMLRAAHAGTPFPLVILDGMMPEMDGFKVAEKIREHAELSGATVMMLSSAMPAGGAARCAELGVASYLTKPVTQSELLDAILIAIGEEAEMEPAPIVRVWSGGLRILLAEDNVINRALATAMLTKRGHSLVQASNGLEAVEMARTEKFDLILMDVQMPEMDGFKATRRIREMEEPLGRHTPIAAMTAHAMASDRERCLAAGMDHYISKPLEKAELLALLERIAAGHCSAGAALSPTDASLADVFHGTSPDLPREIFHNNGCTRNC